MKEFDNTVWSETLTLTDLDELAEYYYASSIGVQPWSVDYIVELLGEAYNDGERLHECIVDGISGGLPFQMMLADPRLVERGIIGIDCMREARSIYNYHLARGQGLEFSAIAGNNRIMCEYAERLMRRLGRGHAVAIS